MNTPTPRTIAEYLEQLRAALRGADPALIQDALYDAEEHLRGELHENPGTSEAEMLAKIASSYGAPEEVAAIYVDKEVQVEQALRSPPPPRRTTALGRFFAIGSDPRAYASLFYMLLALPTGIFYFVWAVTGVSLSLGLMVLVIGFPFAVLFLSTVRALSLVEGRLIEVMLGERMPRRPLYADQGKPFLTRVKEMFTDPRTWSTLLYLMLRLPLGIVYFVMAVVGTVLSLALMFVPVVHVLWSIGLVRIDWATDVHFNDGMLLPPVIADPLCFALGVALLFGFLHLARGVGRFQGALGKHLLVKSVA
jgi:uncharacterized membrane protein